MASDAAADAAGAFFQAAASFDALLGRHEGEMAADAAEEAAAASRAAAEAAAAERAHYAGAAAEEEEADAADGDEEAAAEDAEQAFDADAGEAAAAAGAEEAAAAAGAEEAEEAEEAAHEEAAAAAGAEEAEADVVLDVDIDSADEDGCADAALTAVSEPRDDSSGAAVSEAPISGGSAQSSGSAAACGRGQRSRRRVRHPPTLRWRWLPCRTRRTRGCCRSRPRAEAARAAWLQRTLASPPRGHHRRCVLSCRRTCALQVPRRRRGAACRSSIRLRRIGSPSGRLCTTTGTRPSR